MYLGDFKEDATVRVFFNTRQADGTPITLAGTPTAAVYKDNSVTEITAGVGSIVVDFDGKTGLHYVPIDTAADPDYSTGAEYKVVLTAGTVDSVSVVGVKVAEFSIENRANITDEFAGQAATDIGDLPTNSEFNARSLPSADYFVVGDYIAPPTASDIRAAVGLASANLDTQLADIPTVSEFNARSLPSADYFVVGDYTAPPSAADIRSAVGLAAANLDTQLGDIPTVAEFEARSLPSADYFVVGDYTVPPTTSQIVTAIAGWQPLWAGGSDFSTVLESLYDETFGSQALIQSIDAIADKLDTAMELDGAVYRFTTNSLENAPSGGGSLTAADVWDYLIAGSPGAGSAGAALAAAGSAGDPWSTLLPGSYTAGQAGWIIDVIYDKALLITTQPIYSSNPVNANGEIDRDIVIGSDYLAANGQAFKWTVPIPSGYIVGTSSCKFGGRHVRSSVSSAWNITGTVSDNGNGTADLSFDMTKVVSGALLSGLHHFSVDFINAGGTEITPVKSGKLVNVVEKQT